MHGDIGNWGWSMMIVMPLLWLGPAGSDRVGGVGVNAAPARDCHAAGRAEKDLRTRRNYRRAIRASEEGPGVERRWREALQRPFHGGVFSKGSPRRARRGGSLGRLTRHHWTNTGTPVRSLRFLYLLSAASRISRRRVSTPNSA